MASSTVSPTCHPQRWMPMSAPEGYICTPGVLRRSKASRVRQCSACTGASVRRRYHPFPFSVFRLHDTLGPYPQLLLEAARGWYAARPGSFSYTGGHFVSAVMKGKEAALVEALKVFAQSGTEDDALFALS